MAGALLIDTSHYNALPNFPALGAGGVCGVIGKVSEGAGFADPTFAATRAGAHAAGLLLGGYHFTRLGNPAAEAAWFARCLGGSLRPGEFAGLDLEVAAAGVNPVVWTGQWLDALAGLGVTVRLLYLNKTELAGFDWSPIARRGVLLWLADYDGAQSAAGVPVGAFGALTLKQYASTGSVAGEAGQVDVDWSPLSAAQLTAALTGATTTVQEDDMRLVRNADTGGVYLETPFDMQPINNPADWEAHTAAGIPNADVTGAQFAILQAYVDARRKALLTDVQSFVLGKNPAAADQPWLFDRLVEIDGKVGQSAPVDAAAVGAALAGDAGFVQAVVAGVVTGIDADLVKRFGPAT